MTARKAGTYPEGTRPANGGAWSRTAYYLKAVDKHKSIVAEIPRLRRYAWALQGDREDADDLVQDCVERALSHAHLFRAGTNMRAWLFTIMHNVHVNSVRRQRRAKMYASSGQGIVVARTTQPSQFDAAVLRDLSLALADLAEEQRQVVLLIGLEGMSYREAADILGLPIGTVKSRLARGREHLGQLMDGQQSQDLMRTK